MHWSQLMCNASNCQKKTVQETFNELRQGQNWPLIMIERKFDEQD